jgi:hypothetical protein
MNPTHVDTAPLTPDHSDRLRAVAKAFQAAGNDFGAIDLEKADPSVIFGPRGKLPGILPQNVVEGPGLLSTDNRITAFFLKSWKLDQVPEGKIYALWCSEGFLAGRTDVHILERLPDGTVKYLEMKRLAMG